MSRTTLEIECLDRLHGLTGLRDQILSFLVEESVITKDDTKTIFTSSNQSKATQELLNKLKQKNLIQLLEYEWVVLPVERIKVTIVTDRNSQEFTFG